MTVREITSEIQNDLRTVNHDEWLSRRFIFNKLKSLVSYYTRQEELWKLFKDESIFILVDCILMEEKPLVDCCNINILTCNQVMRSMKKLPELLLTMYGNIIKVYNIEGEEYRRTTLSQYRNTLKGEFNSKQKFFWIQNDYIVILNSQVEVVSIWGLFSDKSKAKKMNECLDESSDYNDILKSNCDSLLDEEFVCLKHLEAIVKEKALTSLLNSIRRINNDNNLNTNTNIK